MIKFICDSRDSFVSWGFRCCYKIEHEEEHEVVSGF